MKEKFKQMKGIRKKDNQYGITLIALVITIIVLLILAGVSIAMLTGQNGILTQAQKAKTETENAAKNEAGILNDYEDKINKALGVKEQAEPGKYYETDTEVELGGKTLTIPGGASISKILGEYESIDNGLVIYITNKQITDEEWQDAETMQKTYDQFVWVPVKEALAVDMNGDNTIDKTDIDLMVAEGRYPMAIKTSESPETYKGILYDFTEEGGVVKVTAKDYTTTSSYREPAFLTNTSYADGSSYNNVGITESSLQAEYNGMIKVVEEAGGFWVGRYETSKMSTDTSKDTSTTDFIQVIKGTTEGINNVNWYRMYAQQKNYEKHLSKSNVKSSMIWGSQWDQIMIWMKEKENTTKGGFYVTNSVGMGNYGNISGVDDGYDDTNNPSATGCFDVKNIYDLAGNVYDWTLEALNTNYRVLRRRQLR